MAREASTSPPNAGLLVPWAAELCLGLRLYLAALLPTLLAGQRETEMRTALKQVKPSFTPQYSPLLGGVEKSTSQDPVSLPRLENSRICLSMLPPLMRVSCWRRRLQERKAMGLTHEDPALFRASVRNDGLEDAPINYFPALRWHLLRQSKF